MPSIWHRKYRPNIGRKSLRYYYSQIYKLRKIFIYFGLDFIFVLRMIFFFIYRTALDIE